MFEYYFQFIKCTNIDFLTVVQHLIFKHASDGLFIFINFF